MKKIIKYSLAGIMTSAIIGSAACFSASAATVDVYAEGAYTDTELDIYIYADITGNPLVSAGVTLSFDPGKLSLIPAATDQTVDNDDTYKNTSDWYFGDPTGTTYSYQQPELNSTGDGVIILTGKIDSRPEMATDGVVGTHVLIGKVTFNRTDGGVEPLKDPTTGNAADYFGSGLGLGIVRTPPAEFANFVTNAEEVLDSTDSLTMLDVLIYERGDANASGGINVNDILRIKQYLNADEFPVYVDCNDSGNINVNDILCVKTKL